MEKNYEKESDEELAAAALTEEPALYWLLKRYEKKLIAYVIRISGLSVEDAEDIVSETFLSMYKNLNGFDRRLKFSSWIYRIAHNAAISHFRKSKAQKNDFGWRVDDDQALERLESDLDLEKDLDKKLMAEKIKIALEKLDLKYREVLVLYFWEGYGYEEISDILKKPSGTVSSLIRRAKKEISKIIN